uniref:GBR6 n=1 Tax=Panax ginseng TaxID=4054 RepID=Q7Y086_PANGI|nr:GBR6 [Panax ginseng]
MHGDIFCYSIRYYTQLIKILTSILHEISGISLIFALHPVSFRGNILLSILAFYSTKQYHVDNLDVIGSWTN